MELGHILNFLFFVSSERDLEIKGPCPRGLRGRGLPAGPELPGRDMGAELSPGPSPLLPGGCSGARALWSHLGGRDAPHHLDPHTSSSAHSGPDPASLRGSCQAGPRR